MRITSWPENDRPRERLIKHGAGALSDAELLAIFLRTGIKGKTALDLARELLLHFGTIEKLLDSELDEFSQVKGMGQAKFCQLKASLELVRRNYQFKAENPTAFNDPETVKMYLLNHFPQKKHENFACLFLDNKNQIIKFEILFVGSINQAQVYPRVIAQKCLQLNAAAVILAHNHPSGCTRPSQSDQDLTVLLQKTLKLIEVRVLDHFVVGNNEVQSMAQLGMI